MGWEERDMDKFWLYICFHILQNQTLKPDCPVVVRCVQFIHEVVYYI